MGQEKVTKEMMRQAAALAGLELSDARIEELLPRFEALMQGIRSLSELDTSAVGSASIFSAKREAK